MPLLKVNKVIKKYKPGKIVSVVGAMVFAICLEILIIGEANHKSGLPSVISLIYMNKAKTFAGSFINNDMESFFCGFSEMLSGGEFT